MSEKKPVTRDLTRSVKRAFTADAKNRKLVEENNKASAARTTDSIQNFQAAIGLQTNNLMASSTYGFNPITRVRTILEWIHRGSWLGGVAVDLVADDMTRAGVDLVGEIDPKDIAKLEESLVALRVWQKINETIKWSRLYGGAIGVYLIDGQALHTPFRIETVGKNQFKGILPLDRWMVEPSLQDLVTDLGPHLGMPKFYRVTNDSPALWNKKIHYTRCFRLEGIKLPYWQRLMENMWGISVLERLYDKMVGFDSATQGAAQLVFKAHIRVYKVDKLRELISAGGPMLEAMQKWVNFMRLQQSLEGMTLIDMKDEYETHSASSFGGIDDVIRQIGEQISGALQIPLVRLFGQSPAGLNSSGDSDLRTYYDGIKQQQESNLHDPVTTIYRCSAQSMGMTLPEGFGVGFRSLWQLTDAEKAEIAKSLTETVLSANTSGLVSDKTALMELKQGSKITGVWTNISQKDINDADDVAAPKATGAPGEGGEEGAPEPEEKEKTKKKAQDAGRKMTKSEARYVDKSVGLTHCGLCRFFNLERGECQIVEGEIKAQGGCTYFEPKNE